MDKSRKIEEKYRVNLEEIVPLDTKDERDFYNMVCRVLIDKARTKSGCLFRATFFPDGFHAQHLHTKSDEFVYINSGRGVKGIKNKLYEIRPETAFFIPKGVIHWMKNTSSKEFIEVVGVYPEVQDIENTGYKFIGDISSKLRGG